MTPNERRTIKGVIRRLDPGTAGCSPEVRKALEDPKLRIYLDTWVIPALQLLVKQDRTREDIAVAVDLAN
jgi:hypothetical protein